MLAVQAVAELTFRYVSRTRATDRPTIHSSAEAVELLRPLFEPHMETFEAFRILLLDRANGVKGAVTISTGGLHGTVVDPKLLFAVALRTLSCGVILAHNHPSGQLRPSSEDLELTQKLVRGGKQLDITIHDHVIISREGFFSLADSGYI